MMSNVGCSWPMLRMAIWRSGAVDPFELDDLLVDLRVAVAAGAA